MKNRLFWVTAITLLAWLVPLVGCVAQEPFTFVQLCDTQLGMGGYEHDVETFKRAVNEINALRPDFVLICGDLVNDENSDEAVADFNSIRAGFDGPNHPAPGNHDVGNEPTAASLVRYRKLIGKDYYTFDHKGYAFVVVNTQLWKAPVQGESEKHDEWFATTLRHAKERNTPVIVAGHYPPFLEDIEEEEAYFNLPLKKRREIMALCKANGVVAFLAGHVHRNQITSFEGMPIVASASTSRNGAGDPLGFRVWKVGPHGTLNHEYIALGSEGRPPKP